MHTVFVVMANSLRSLVKQHVSKNAYTFDSVGFLNLITANTFFCMDWGESVSCCSFVIEVFDGGDKEGDFGAANNADSSSFGTITRGLTGLGWDTCCLAWLLGDIGLAEVSDVVGEDFGICSRAILEKTTCAISELSSFAVDLLRNAVAFARIASAASSGDICDSV